MKVIEILRKYGLLQKEATWDRENQRYIYSEEYKVVARRYVNCKEGGRKELDKYIQNDVIAYHLEDYGGFFIIKGNKLFYAFVVFNSRFCSGGLDYKSSRCSNLDEIENKIDLTKVTIVNNELFNEFTDEVKRIKLKNLANNI